MTARGGGAQYQQRKMEFTCRATLVGASTSAPAERKQAVLCDNGRQAVHFTMRCSPTEERAAWMEIVVAPVAQPAVVLRADNTMALPTAYMPVVEARRDDPDSGPWAVHVELPGLRSADHPRARTRLVLRCDDSAHAHHPNDAKAPRTAVLCPVLLAAAHLQMLCERQATVGVGRSDPPRRSLRQ